MALTEGDSKIKEVTIDCKKHWNTTYLKNQTENLGWYEEKSEQTLALIQETKLPKNATLLNVGAGSSCLIDNLIEEGFSNIIANDLSNESLKPLKHKFDKNNKIEFIVDDLLNPSELNKLKNIDLWNDRAVLHFFLKKEEVTAYFNLLKMVLKPKGFVIIAVFAKNGADKCAGLPLKKYDAKMIENELGNDFELKKSFNYTFINPFGGERPYIYTLFQRKN
jgi:SAM-dependent methyltransferase